MSRSWIRDTLLPSTLALGAAACPSSAFECEADAQCLADGLSGLCEPSGYCSFPDGDCASGHRYGDNAPTGLAGECAPVVEGTGTATGSAATDTSAATTAEPPTASADGSTSSPVADTSTTTSSSGPVESTTSSDGGETTGSSAESGSTTGTPACVPTFADDFADGNLDPAWMSWADAGCSVQETAGALEFTIGPSELGRWLSTGVYTGFASALGSRVRASFAGAVGDPDAASVWLTVADAAGCELHIAREGSDIVAVHTGTPNVVLATDPAVDVWLQIEVDPAGAVTWSMSDDGIAWVEVRQEPMSTCALDSTFSAVFAGGAHAQVRPVVRAALSYER